LAPQNHKPTSSGANCSQFIVLAKASNRTHRIFKQGSKNALIIKSPNLTQFRTYNMFWPLLVYTWKEKYSVIWGKNHDAIQVDTENELIDVRDILYSTHQSVLLTLPQPKKKLHSRTKITQNYGHIVW